MKKSTKIGIIAGIVASILLLAIIVTCVLLIPGKAPTVEVATRLGKVKGIQQTTGSGYAYEAFLAVPYAESPPMRFAKPRSARSWDDVWDATRPRDACATPEKPILGSQGNSEDCLYLKILRPSNVSSRARLPVLFWIHGGNFLGGSSNDYDVDVQAEHFVRQGLVVVQPSTRVGAFGYFATGNPDAAGNWGAWDAAEALQWTHAHVRSFGGDPGSVTLMGQSGGAVLASLLTLSPSGPRYERDFHRAVLLAGSMWQPQVAVRSSVWTARNQALATAAGCDDAAHSGWRRGRFATIIACLRGLDTAAVLSAMAAANLSSALAWHPVAEDGPQGLFPQPLPALAQRRPNVPVLLGTNGDSASWDLFVRPTLASFSAKTFSFQPPPDFDTRTNTREGPRLACDAVVGTDNYQEDRLASVIQDCYEAFGRAPSPTWFDAAVRVGTSFRQQAPVLQEARAWLERGNRRVWLYSFDYVRRNSTEHADWWRTAGAFGNLELAFLENFVLGYDFVRTREDDYVTNVTTHAIANFARFGDPNGDRRDFWPPLNREEEERYLSFQAPVRIRSGYASADTDFWFNHPTDAM